MKQKLLLHVTFQLLKWAGLLLDQIELTHADEPITAGDPGGRYVPLRVIPGRVRADD